MASIILKKRTLCESIEEGLDITPSSFEVKKRIGENGEYMQLYESILPQLKVLFPAQEDQFLLGTLKAYKNDIISTIEYLKYFKPPTPLKTSSQLAESLDQNVLSTLDQLSACKGEQHAYEILNCFKKDVLNPVIDEKEKLSAENQLLRKFFKIQKKVILGESFKRQENDELIIKKTQELEKARLDTFTLVNKLGPLEKSSLQKTWNGNIF